MSMSAKYLVAIAAITLLTAAKGEGCSVSVDGLEDELAGLEEDLSTDDEPGEPDECPPGEVAELVCEDAGFEYEEGPEAGPEEGPEAGTEEGPEEGPDDEFDEYLPDELGDSADGCEVICVPEEYFDEPDDDWDDHGHDDGEGCDDPASPGANGPDEDLPKDD